MARSYPRPLFGLLLLFAWHLLIGPSQAEDVSNQLAKLLQNPGLSQTKTGIQVLSARTGQVIYQKNATASLAPASNMKLLTSAAAMSLLKPEFRFKTMLYTDGSVKQGMLEGHLYLKGMGDPDLQHAHLEEMAKELKYLGVKEIKGDLIADDSYFDQQQTGKGWKNTYGAATYSARISALSLNQNTVTVRIQATTSRQPATITLIPENKFFQIVNQTYCVAGRTQLKISRSVVNNRNQIVVSGAMSLNGAPEMETLNLDFPALYTGSVFESALQHEGIKINGHLRKGITPKGQARVLAVNQSRPLNEIINELNKNSINMIAEHLLKFLGANFLGEPGTADKGAQVIITRFLQKEVGANTTQIKIADGSGLSPLNRLTPDLLAKVLRYMYNRYDLTVDYMSSMAVAGVDGTLKNRLHPYKRRIRAKTGFIDGVSALSGYIYTQHSDLLVFSILMNEYSNFSAARTAQDSVCAILSQKM